MMSKEENNCIIIFLTYIWCVHCYFTRSNLLFGLTNILTILKYNGFIKGHLPPLIWSLSPLHNGFDEHAACHTVFTHIPFFHLAYCFPNLLHFFLCHAFYWNFGRLYIWIQKTKWHRLVLCLDLFHHWKRKEIHWPPTLMHRIAYLVSKKFAFSRYGLKVNHLLRENFFYYWSFCEFVMILVSNMY